MSLPKQLAVWITASSIKHFVAKRQSVHLHAEEFERNTDDKEEWFEHRVDGPTVRHIAKNQYELTVETNILISCTQGPIQNAYRVKELIGIVTAAFTNLIPVYRLGPSSDPANDGTQLGCLRLIPGETKERVVVSFFGKIRPEGDLTQASVEGHYQMFLDV